MVFVVEKLLVIHLQTRRQNTDIGFMMVGGGDQTADLYRRMGAMRERASIRHRCGERPIPGGERRRTVAKDALVSVSFREK